MSFVNKKGSVLLHYGADSNQSGNYGSQMKKAGVNLLWLVDTLVQIEHTKTG